MSKKQIAFSIVNSILIGATALVFNWALNSHAQTPKDPKVLPAVSFCPGKKLNYPKVVREKLPNGKTVEFRYNCIREGFIASSYDGACPGCSGRTHFTNEPVRWGVCAVDQNTIEPHSEFYVPGYGPCRAADKGAAVNGKKIDVGFSPNEVKWWSRRETPIYTFVN